MLRSVVGCLLASLPVSFVGSDALREFHWGLFCGVRICLMGGRFVLVFFLLESVWILAGSGR